MAVNEMNKKPELIFIPSPGIGHLASSLEYAKLLINTNNNLSITVICIKFPGIPFADSYIKSALASQPQIQLIDLPQVELPPQELLKSPEFFILTFMESLIPHVKATIQTILSDKVVGLVLDFFCLSMIDVGNELGIPSYLFMTSNVGFLSLMLSLQNRRIEDVFDDSDPDRQFLIHGFSNLVPSNVLPDAVFNKDGGYVAYYKFAERFRDTKGIIVNTFSDLEQYSIDALSNHDEKIPPIYAVGPLLDLKEQQLNAFRMVKEWGLAVELRVDYRKGSENVVAEEIEKGLKDLMDRDNIVHKKVQEIKEKARNAIASGGSSFISVGKFIDNVIGSN
ncbi:hypothetical protein KIW84_021889 [Lathyrus oleraceus]|uniref:Uncharacterized protein n=1 Tax=Pisum sativum TaxID=3888 RepID=A0A9D4YBS9_PEA|nr:hypothetical protein KIW84_021889 [Pisum sativum]